MNLDTVGLWLGRLLMAGYLALVAVEAPRYFRSAMTLPDAPGEAADEPLPLPWPRVLAQALVAFALSRLLILLVCAAYFLWLHHGLETFVNDLLYKLKPWDANHYLGLIENLYVTEGDSRLHIVFLPLFPVICRALRWLTGLSAFASAELVANGATLGCGCALYRLMEPEHGRTVARRAMLLFMFNPAAYFYSVAYTESTFLLTTLLAVLLARRRRWGWALLFGAMSACARITGILVAIPIFWELLRADREAAAERGAEETPRAVARRLAVCFLKVLPVSAGLLLYLNLNYRLFGNPFQFMIFQREHWHQSFGSMANTFRYSLCNALEYDDFLYRLGVWLPQALLLLAMPVFILWRRRRENPPDTAYLLVFHYISFAPTWLLSGPRYLSSAYPLYTILAKLPKNRRDFAELLAAECALLIYMTLIGLCCARVY